MPRTFMKKLAFVFPWFSKEMSGEVEVALAELTRHLADTGVALEILTTCVEGYHSDWGANFFARGIEQIDGIKIRRFKAEARKADAFMSVNRKLAQNRPLSAEEEVVFLNETVNSDELMDYIATHRDNYSLFVFAPYLSGTTYFGITAAGKKAVMIPFLKDEPSAKMELAAQQYAKVSGMVFLSQAEASFAQSVYDLSSVHTRVLGLGVDARCALQYFVSHPKRAAGMGKDNQNFVIGELSWDKAVKDYVAFFEEVDARVGAREIAEK